MTNKILGTSLDDAKVAYITTSDILRRFSELNADTIVAFTELTNARDAALTELKDACKASGLDIEVPETNEKLTLVQPYKKWVDAQQAKAIVGEVGKAKENMLLKSLTVTKVEVEYDAFVKAIDKGLLPDEARVACKEAPLAPRVNITKK